MTPYGYPTDQYHCLLDEQPYYLVPRRLYGHDSGERLVVNPDCWFSWHGTLPADKATRVAGAEWLLPSDWLVWVADPASESVWPYWVDEEYAGYLTNLAPGIEVGSELPPHAVWTLTRANILVDYGYAQRRRREWQELVWACARGFAQRGYTVLPQLIPPFHLGALRRYYRYHTRIGSFTLGDDQVSRRHVAHNEGVASFLHGQLAPAVADIARTLVKPSYVYLAAYESGSILDRHTDREQCEYSVTMCIDATPEPSEQSPWPIRLDVADGALAVWQYLGDSLLYRGRYLPHYREPLPEDQTSTSLLFHYVDDSFAGPLG
jgi:hypothetical protein